MASTRLFLFGDQTVEPQLAIKQLVKQAKTSNPLASFLQVATDVVQFQVAQYPAPERERFYGFTSLQALAKAHADSGVNDTVVSTVLLCIAQLGALILSAESDSSVLETTSDVYMLGLCTGLIPAAAAATARSSAELLRLCPEILRVAIRLAYEADRRSAQLEISSHSWAVVVGELPAKQLQAALDEFHGSWGIPVHKRAYISAEADSSTTISGPPSVLALLFANTQSLKKAIKVNLPITSAFHAPHLAKINADKIIGSSALFNAIPKSGAHVMSTSSGKPFSAATLNDLLRQIADDVLQIPLYWTKTVSNMAASIGSSDVTLTTFGPTNAVKSLRRNLEQAGAKLAELASSDAQSQATPRGGSGAIAIIGMAGRFPGSETLEEFWEVLEKGKDLHTKIPKRSFDVETHWDKSGARKNTTLSPYGCFIERPGLFDTKLFNMSPREAAQIDPTQRLLLLSTYEALELSGYTQEGSLATDSRRIGTFFGQTTDDWREINAAQDVDLYYVPGGMRAFGPGRLNYHFKWEGPSYSIDTACSSSAASIEFAVSSLLLRECDTAVAGGGNIMTGVNMFAGLSRGGFLSKTGSCKTYDDGADGYCRGEAVGVVVLKRLEDAIADNDNITGVIRAVSTNHSAHAISITHPHAETQSKLYAQTLAKACVDASDVEYVEMHGTGTQAGDTMEMESVTGTFAVNRKKDNPLFVGSVKANVGHGEAAAGITSIIKNLLMLKKNIIPPHAGIKTKLNHKFPDLDAMNVKIAREPTAFKARPNGDGRRKIMLNNFNATGGNTCILLEDGPKKIVEGKDPRSAHVITTSARTTTSLRGNKERLLAYLEANSEVSLADVAYTTTARRMHHVFRSAYTVTSVDELIATLKKDLAGTIDPTRAAGKPTIVMAFTGQGSQYSGMGKQLYETSPIFREKIHECDAICREHGLPSFLELITSTGQDIKEVSPVRIQLGIASLEISLAAMWSSWGIQPDLVIGHSLGEYAALTVAGVLSVSDMLFLVGKRAVMMEEKCTIGTHAMLAIQQSLEYVQDLLKSEKLESAGIACRNSPSSTVVSGTIGDLKVLADKMAAAKIKTSLLETPYAFHSPQLDPILEDFEKLAKTIVRYAAPKIPVASTFRGDIVVDGGVFDARYLTKQARQEVNFVGALQSCKEKGLVDDKTLWVECGPESVCLALARSTLDLPPTRALPSLKAKEDCWKTICKAATNIYNAGGSIVWPDFHQAYVKSLSLLELPTYAFELKENWLQYEGDWALTKNHKVASTGASTKAIEVAPFGTTTLQSITSEEFGNDKATVSFASDPSEPKLFAAIQGHLVGGLGLCPSTVYSDMALTAAKYVYEKMEAGKSVPNMGVNNMEVHHPLVVLPDSQGQLIKVKAVRAAGADVTEIFFSSEHHGEHHEHGHCKVVYGNGKQWMSNWARSSYLVEDRMEHLEAATATGAVHKMLGPLVYKLFSALVYYSQPYRGLTEVYMDAGKNEVAAKLKFQPSASEGTFTYSPYWLDSIIHLAGFVLNGNIEAPEGSVYISHGWESLKIGTELSESKEYTTYVRMQPMDNKGLYAGDVYMFEGKDVVAVCTGLKFQEMKKNTLMMLLGGNSAPSAPASRSAPKMAAAPKKAAKTKAPKKIETAPAPTGQTFQNVLDTIAGEAGIGMADLTDEANFSDLGVDSLLTISITGKLREQTGLDLPTAMITMYPTVKELRDYFSDLFAVQGIWVPSKTPVVAKAPKAKKAAPAPKKAAPSTSGSFASVLDTIAGEAGIGMSDLTDDANFSDLGVDSLLTISITGKLREQTGLDLPTSMITMYPTVKELRDFFSEMFNESGAAQVVELDDDFSDSDLDTPSDIASSVTSLDDDEDIPDSKDDGVLECFLATTAAETGVDVSELTNDSLFSDLGVDSLMSIAILGVVKEQTGRMLPAAFFNENPSIADVKEALAAPKEAPVFAPSKAVVKAAPRSKGPTKVGVDALAKLSGSKAVVPYNAQKYTANTVFLQGKPNSGLPNLFLIADGAGSAASYINIAPFPSGLPVWALESPFLHCPLEYNCNVEGVAAKYVQEIRKIQPVGPYMLGGWSLGGIHAYEVARQLLNAGEEVRGIVMIDSPCPKKLEDMPEPTLELMEQTGLFIGVKRAGKPDMPMAIETKQHLVSCVKELSQFEPVPMEEKRRPGKTVMIWARNGIFDELGGKIAEASALEAKKADGDSEPEVGLKKDWLTAERKSYGPNGWDRLVGDIECHNIEGDHFSVMNLPRIKVTGSLMHKAVAEFLEMEPKLT
ncbi:hypothetical protein MMC25_007213 [Agyrium rufum]|nr:hypothetical protein [Agyrium rufum]